MNGPVHDPVDERALAHQELARLAEAAQGAADAQELARRVMAELPPLVGAQYGVCYLPEETEQGVRLTAAAGYGCPDDPAGGPRGFALGQGLVGEAARGRRPITVDDLPPGYATVTTGTGTAEPAALVLLPVVRGERLLAVLEVAALRPFTPAQRGLLDGCVRLLAAELGALHAERAAGRARTESERLAAELAERTAELRKAREESARAAAERERAAALLAERDRALQARDRELERARQELEQRARQLSLASMYKTEFLANMSHELRTPLNSLLILAQLLAQNPEHNLTPKQVDYANVIHAAGSDLLELINGILEVSRTEAGQLEAHPLRVALAPLLAELDAAFRPGAAAKSLEFALSTAPGLPDEVVTDGSRLREILRNLLSNAVKFTDAGRVELRVEYAKPEDPPAEEREGPMLAFHVSDTGVGIPEDDLGRVFDLFQQGGTTVARPGGTGLGLSISSRLAQLLGGAVTVESTPGEGSRFTLLLPVRPPGAEPDGPPREEGRLDGRVLLVIDDDARNRYALSGALEPYGAEVLHAENGLAGIELLRARPDVDLVLMDLMMPLMDGHAAIAEIRSRAATAQLPVIVVTARALPEDRARSLAAGADDVIVKPVDTEDLLARVRRLLG
jgi:signal transduction histidine kinase